VIVLVDIDSIKKGERLRITYDRAPLGVFETDLDVRFIQALQS
jgi:hypothetical protein